VRVQGKRRPRGTLGEKGGGPFAGGEKGIPGPNETFAGRDNDSEEREHQSEVATRRKLATDRPTRIQKQTKQRLEASTNILTGTEFKKYYGDRKNKVIRGAGGKMTAKTKCKPLGSGIEGTEATGKHGIGIKY